MFFHYYKRQRRIAVFLPSFVCAFVLFALPAWNAEILWQDGPDRVVSGDWAAWTTRGLSGIPSKTEIGDQAVRDCVDKIDAELTEDAVAALGKGIRLYGWAQFEREPERVARRFKVRAYASPDEKKVSIERLHSHDGIDTRAVISLPGGPIQIENLNEPHSSDSTVMATLLSVENFVVSQEHYQKQFFESMINLDLPGMEPVRAAYEKGDRALAVYELAEFYRRKTEPARFIHKPVAQSTENTNPAGETVCTHVLSYRGETFDLGPVIQWNRHPSDNAEWLWWLNRHGIFHTLLGAYLNTGNEKYAREYVALITDWIVNNPAPPYTLTRVATWRNLEVGGRVSDTWPATFYGFLCSPSFSPQAIQLVLGSLWSHGDYLYHHPAGLRRPSNWSVVDSTGLAALPIFFPEFKDSDLWRKEGYERLAYQLQLQVLPDGAQWELSTSYHCMCLNRFKVGLDLARDYNVKLPDDLNKRFESMYDFLMWTVKPNFDYPALSDSSPSSVQGFIREAAHRFDRADMQYVATRGKEGQPPETTSKLLESSGLGILRSGWDANALYLCFDAGPVGTNHQHDDKLAIILSAYGKNFLVDVGPSSYRKDKWRWHAISTAAHSTVLIDGLGQERIENKQELIPSETEMPFWESNDRYDYAVGRYSCGYGLDKIPVVHERHVVFRKPEYWIVVDRILGEGEHKIESRFQFADDLEVHADGLKAATSGSDQPNLSIEAAPLDGLKLDVVKGQAEPVLRGWILTDRSKQIPAPLASYTIHSELPQTIVYLLYPSPAGENAGAMISECNVDDETVQMKITRKGITDTLRLSLQDKTVELQEN